MNRRRFKVMSAPDADGPREPWAVDDRDFSGVRTAVGLPLRLTLRGFGCLRVGCAVGRALALVASYFDLKNQ